MNLPKISTFKPHRGKRKTEITESTPNLLNKQFAPPKPNEVWVSDIAYVRVGGRWHYICVIIDLFSRKLIAWKASKRADTTLTTDTLQIAYTSRNIPKNVLFHSDRGTQYTSQNFRKLIDNLDFIQSFSAKAHPFVNAVSESFLRFLKSEQLYRFSFTTLQQLEISLFEYANFYNNLRPHSFNDGLSPNQKEFVFFDNSE